MRRIAVVAAVMALACVNAAAQFYTGMSGLIHVPSAETFEAGDMRVGTYFMNKEFTPSQSFVYGGERYNTMDFYISVTPFSWVELGYAFTLMKSFQGDPPKVGYNAKDRYLSIKFTPLRESRYWPSVSVGGNDFLSTLSFDDGRKSEGDGGSSEYFRNLYVAMTKHVDFRSQRFGATLAYRHFNKAGNERWNGLVGAVTWRPGFASDGRVIVEWDGCRVNAGVDYVFWRHLCVQAAFVGCRHFTGGVCYRVNLF